jgi:hypothetical protein
MSLFNKNIVVLCLSKEGKYLALKVSKGKAGLEVLKSASFEDDLSTFNDQLDLSANDYVVFCDDGSLAVSVSLTLPKLSEKELLNAVSFELGSQIPLPIDSIKWGYSREGNRCQLSVLSREIWEDLMLKTRGIHLDFFMTSTALPELSPELNNISTNMSVHEASDLYMPALKVAMFCLSQDMTKLKKTMLTPPEERRLKHRFISKYLMVACVAYVLVSLLISGLSYIKDKGRYSAQLNSRIAQIDSVTPRIDEEAFAYLNEVNIEFLTIAEKVYSPADILDEIALRLPDKYLIKSLRTDGLTVNCELTSQDGILDTKEIFSAFTASDFFTNDIPISQRKGSLQLTLTLNAKGVLP